MIPSIEQSIVFSVDGKTKSVMMEIPHHFVGLIIGRKGKTIKSIQETAGCLVWFEQFVPDSEPRKLFIRGDLLAVDKAVSMVKDIVESSPTFLKYQAGTSASESTDNPAAEELFTEIYECPNNRMGLLFGIGGENLQRITSKSGALITINRHASGMGSKRILIYGSQSQVKIAVEMLMQLYGTAAGCLVRVPYQASATTAPSPVEQDDEEEDESPMMIPKKQNSYDTVDSDITMDSALTMVPSMQQTETPLPTYAAYRAPPHGESSSLDTQRLYAPRVVPKTVPASSRWGYQPRGDRRGISSSKPMHVASAPFAGYHPTHVPPTNHPMAYAPFPSSMGTAVPPVYGTMRTKSPPQPVTVYHTVYVPVTYYDDGMDPTAAYASVSAPPMLYGTAPTAYPRPQTTGYYYPSH